MSSLTMIGTLLAGIGALAGAWAAWKAAATARDAIRMQILLDFAKRDATPQMGEATKKLWKFRREKNDSKKEYRRRFTELEKTENKKWHDIDNSRRIAHKFYLHLMQAKQAKLITEREIIIGFYKHHFETVLEVLEPLEAEKPGRDYSGPIFKEYKKLYNDYDRLFEKYLGEPPG